VTRILPDERTFQVFYYLLHARSSSLSDQEKSQLRLQETFAYINQSKLAPQEAAGHGSSNTGVSSTSSAFGSNAPIITVSAGMGMDDSLGLEHLRGAMATCGFRPRQIQHIWRLIAAILHLGNLQFTDPVSTSKQSALQEAAIVRNPETLDFIADILGVPSGE
jgi:chitin synthase